MPKARNRFYVAVCPYLWYVVSCPYKPTKRTHEGEFSFLHGPFKTLRGAKARIYYGGTTVEQSEALGKQHAEELKRLPNKRYLN